MTIFAALTRAYEHLAADPDRGAELPRIGYSAEKIGFLIALNPDGSPADRPHDLRQERGRKLLPRLMNVPQPPKRASGIAPVLLWDKTAYSLGVTASANHRTAKEHAAFKAAHETWLAGTTDAGLQALLHFLRQWQPTDFQRLDWPAEMLDANIIFCLESDRLKRINLHDRPAAQALVAALRGGSDAPQGHCLVSGRHGPIARLHSSIKNVWGAQSAGASIVSFNKDAFTSYGHEQGMNAPVSETVAFAYTTILNHFLASNSNRIQIGDASTVFWAEAKQPESEQFAEEAFSLGLGGVDETAAAKPVGVLLQQLRAGHRLSDLRPDLVQGVRFYVLGLAPNASRLSVRFWIEDDFGVITDRYQRYLQETAIEPAPPGAIPGLWRYLLEAAVLAKRENIPPNLAGDWLRAILAGTRYPDTLQASMLMRLRADGDVNALRVAVLRAHLIRNRDMEVPVALDPECLLPGYLLGRLFAVYERIQSASLGGGVNATIKDRFYASAAAQPRKVFALLDRSVAPHLTKNGKRSAGLRINLEKDVAEIMDRLQPGADPFPATMPSDQQALFALGYYHQRSEYFRKKDTADSQEEAA